MQHNRRGFLTLAAGLALPWVRPARGRGAGSIGIALPNRRDTWPVEGAAMVKALTRLGLGTALTFAEDDPNIQKAQIGSMITADAGALVIAAVDGHILEPILADAAASAIPVITYDRLIPRADTVSCHAGWDMAAAGAMQASALLAGLSARFDGTRPWQVEICAGDQADEVAVRMFQGAMAVLLPEISAGSIAVASGQTRLQEVATLKGDGALAHARIHDLLREFHADGTVQGLLAPDDAIAAGLISAAAGAGYGGSGPAIPVITGMGCTLDGVRAILDGNQYCSLLLDRRELATATARAVARLLAEGVDAVTGGRRVETGVGEIPAFLVPPQMVDATNWKALLIDTGYYPEHTFG